MINAIAPTSSACSSMPPARSIGSVRVRATPSHATRDTAHGIVEAHGADHVSSVVANCPDSFAGRHGVKAGATERLKFPAGRKRHPARTYPPPRQIPAGPSPVDCRSMKSPLVPCQAAKQWLNFI